MIMSLDQELDALKQMNVGQLHRKYAEVFGEPTRAYHKSYLWKRIAWRLQVNAEGDISERARRRAQEIAREGDLRMFPPKPTFASDPPSPSAKPRRIVLPSKPKRDDRVPAAGTILGRVYRGKRVEVEVLDNSFRYEGRNYLTMTAVAKQITGTHWNGYKFFGLRKKDAVEKG